MASNREVEVKFRVTRVRSLVQRLRHDGFRQIPRPTHDLNTLYDWQSQILRKRGQLLRLRKYGSQWILTHKAKGKTGRHKTRIETETHLANGPAMDGILRALNFVSTFRYEKFRAEWSDDKGHVVIDQTPIGTFGEIEGPPRWIDRTARALGIVSADYITKTYAELFFEWKRRSRSRADEMTFKAVQQGTRR